MDECGRNTTTSKKPMLKKYYFFILTPDGPLTDFKRHAYILNNVENLVLVHYMGNHNVAEDFPHGNSKQDMHPFYRTVPSYLKSLEENVTNERANVVYKKEIASSTSNQCAPRNMQHLRNLRFKAVISKRISQDALSIVHSFAYDTLTSNFIWKIKTFPDLVVVCGLKEVFEEMDNVFLLKDET